MGFAAAFQTFEAQHRDAKRENKQMKNHANEDTVRGGKIEFQKKEIS